jgi:hypothetical protein
MMGGSKNQKAGGGDKTRYQREKRSNFGIRRWQTVT